MDGTAPLSIDHSSFALTAERPAKASDNNPKIPGSLCSEMSRLFEDLLERDAKARLVSRVSPGVKMVQLACR